MLLRWIVSNILRQAAENQVRDMLQPAAENLQRSVLNGQENGTDSGGISVPDTCDVAVVFAVGIEAQGFVERLDNRCLLERKGTRQSVGCLQDATVVIAESGVGQTKAAKAVELTVGRFHPKWVISAGFAGGLVPDLRRGHILMADVIEDLSGKQLEVGLNVDQATLAETRSVHVGKLLTVDHLIRGADEKLQLGDQHAAIACDMETYSAADACRELKTPFLSVRVISDTVDDQLPREVERLIGQKTTAAKLGAATSAIWGRPSTVKDLWKLHETATRASDTLARFLVQTIEQLKT